MPTAFDGLGPEIRTLFAGVRLRSLSVCDANGEAVWMAHADGLLGPVEHALPLDALDSLQLEPARRCFERPHGDDDVGLVFPAREPAGELRGVVVVIANARNFGGTGQETALQPAMQSMLRRVALLLRSQAAVNETVLMTAPPAAADPRFKDLTLHVQQMLRLKTSGRTRRFEVLLRSRHAAGQASEGAPMDLLTAADIPGSGGTLDRHVVGQLVQWLAQNRETFEAEPASFSVNLSVGALLDPEFPGGIARLLELAQVNPRMLAFEVRESLCRAHPADTQRFVAACEAMKCQVVIDDFTLHSDVLPLLRSPAVRLLKMDAALTADALKDKLAQAMVVAISQAAKVLGAHVVAKRIESTMARQWLAAVGVDFAQGFLLEGLVPLASLGARRTDAAGAKAS